MDTIFSEYLDHKESKFEGNLRVLERRHLNICSISNLGKESNNLEESELFGVKDGD